MPVLLVERFISISLSDLENIGELLGDTVFDCCARSPEFEKINMLPQLPNKYVIHMHSNSFQIMKAQEIDDLLFAARS